MFSHLKLLKYPNTRCLSTTVLENKVIHRVKILNLPTHEMGSIKKFLQSHDLYKYKKAPQWNYAYMNFETEEAARNAMARLNGITFKKHNISTEYTQVSEPPFRPRFKPFTSTPSEMLADQVTPLHKLPYHDQIQKKHKRGVRYLNALGKKLNALPGTTWHCEILDTVPSPCTHGYRTKCEFTIGKNLDGQRTVGFLLGSYRDGCTYVQDARACLHVSEKAKMIAAAMEQYVQQSEHDVYDRVTKVGVWRSLMTRTQRTGDIMVVIQMGGLSEEQLEEEKKRLVAYWKPYHLKTLMVQVGDTTEVLTGDGYVYEEVLGRRFRISSRAFFQVNTEATELLYAQCAAWCGGGDKKTTLLDLCCGTGTIGITMADAVDKVIGVEMVPEAIIDAEANARMNNITNAEFYASKVEEKMDIVMNERNGQVVAILDPPRSGVHQSVIRAVRESEQIQKVIFISCDAKQAMQNFIGLCRPTSNRFKGLPFQPSRAVSIDLFPHTDHCELMIEFIRNK